MQVPVAGMKDIGDAQLILAAALTDEAHHLRQFGARHHTVLRDKIWTEPPNRAEGPLPALPQVGTLLFGAGESHFARLVLAADFHHAVGLAFQTGRGSVQLHDEHRAGVERQAELVMEICRKNKAREVRLARTEQERADLWKCRKRAFGAIGRLSPNFITQDGVVPRSKLPEMMRFIGECSRKYELRIPNVFHAGDGTLHPLILYDERDADQVRRALLASDDILTKCVDMGGSVSGEHGIGAEKIDFMAKQFSVDDLDAMRMLRRVFDPEGRCNPHKMFPGSKKCADFAPRRQASA